MKIDYSLVTDPYKEMIRNGIELTEKSIKNNNDFIEYTEEGKRKFERTGDVRALFSFIDNHKKMAFVVDNHAQLKKMEIFEKALLEAYVSTNGNNFNISSEVINLLFATADKQKLFYIGNPLPEDKNIYKLYRGVSGNGSARRKYGISWTGSLDKAIWFAKRYGFEKPIVYQAQVPKENIYAYDNDRNEDEYLCDIPRSLKLREIWRQTP